MVKGEVLPARSLQGAIVEKVKLNRITFISGETGSGKSSQVPQMLADAGFGPVLCTQPRRLAAVALAKHVAEEMHTSIGGAVGYHIGQQNASGPKSSIVFATAGILLESLMANGEAALMPYKAVILDEVHERSIESDLVLASVKQLLMFTKISTKLVLMSATADVRKFQEYFAELYSQGESLEHVAIPSGPAFSKHRIEVKYLDQVLHRLGNRPAHAVVREQLEVPEAARIITPHLQSLVKDLVVDIHKTEQDPQKVVLVFLPTYRAMEEQELLLNETGLPLHVDALHSSVDMDTCIRAMERADRSHRKVILATSIAESSITISNVAYVIDICRNLRLEWDPAGSCDRPRLTWISVSQADQRRGRTGRTCDGTVYRLVSSRKFSQFLNYENPVILHVSLRKQVLQSTCSRSKATSNPSLLFSRCMAAPDKTRVDAARDYVVSIGAATLVAPRAASRQVLRGRAPPRHQHQHEAAGTHERRLEPTPYGQLLVAMPLSLEASQMAIAGARLGCLRECVLLAAILELSPLPISQPFGQADKFVAHLQAYHPKAVLDDMNLRLIANLLAYEFWETAYADPQRLRRATSAANHGRHGSPNEQPHAHLSLEDGDWMLVDDEWFPAPDVLKQSLFEEQEESEWCARHHLVRAALHGVVEMASHIMEIFHRHRPDFIASYDAAPKYLRCASLQGEEHSCKLEDVASLSGGSESRGCPGAKECTAVPYTRRNGHRTEEQIDKLLAILKEVKVRQVQTTTTSSAAPTSMATTTPLCLFHARGFCREGAQCQFSHATNAKAPPCTFYRSKQGCRWGDMCRYAHAEPTTFAVSDEVMAMPRAPPVFEDATGKNKADLDFVLEQLRSTSPQSVVLLGEGDFSFAVCLSGALNFSPESIVATTLISLEQTRTLYKSASTNIDSLRRRKAHVIADMDARKLSSLPASVLSSVGVLLWNFPFANDDRAIIHIELVAAFFASVFSTFVATPGRTVPRILLSLCNQQFSRWRVERLAREFFLFVTQSWPMDVASFKGYKARRNAEDTQFPIGDPFLYMLEFRAPSIGRTKRG